MDPSIHQAKNALVASLFELSNAATEAATATVNFYKAAGFEGSDIAGEPLKSLSDSVSEAARSATSALTNGSVDPKKAVKAKKKPTDSTTKLDLPDADLIAKASLSEALVPEALTPPDATGKAEKLKKKRAEKDPNAPKKPLTSYLRFNLSVRDELRKQRFETGQPTFQATELNQIIADKWANLSEPEKQKLQKAYETEFEQYKKNLEEYKLKKQNEAGAPSANGTSEVSVEAPKEEKKKKSSKKSVELPDASILAAEAVAAAVAEATKDTAKEPGATDEHSSSSSSKKSKKRKDKDSDEKKSKKKKSEHAEK